jgi:DNA-binding CsgD family transcriptional regulator
LTARSLNADVVRALATTLDFVSVHTVMLDGDGRCVRISPGAATLMADGGLLTVRLSRLRRSATSTAVAECPASGSLADIDHDLQPCIGCITRRQAGDPRHRHCAISISGPHQLSIQLQLTAIPPDQQELLAAAALLVIRPQNLEHNAELLPDIAVLLTAAERDVAAELLGGRRPAEIATARRVAVGTVRSQIKRIYAKSGVSGLAEFIAKARR